MDDRLLASGGRVQGVALRTEADFFAQLRASPSAATPVPGSATRRALVGAGSPDITTPEIDALLEKLARGSPSELVDHDAPNNLPPSASKRAAVTPTRAAAAAAARRSPKSARGGRPRWTSARPDQHGVWVPVEQMPKPPPSFAPHSSATPGRSTPTALVGDVVTRVADTGERVQYVTPKRHSSEPDEADGDPNPNPNSHPGGVPEPDVATGAALYADFSHERDHPNLPYSRLPVFERLYRRIPEGQRKKFAFSPGANGSAIGGAFSPSTDGAGPAPKELVEKRREIESLRAELAAREKSETAGDASRRTARALEAARRGTPNGLPPRDDDQTLDETFDGTESDDEREEAALARAEAAHIARLAKMHGASPHKSEYSATRVSARPTDVPVVRIEDDPESVAWELSANFDQTSKPPWQERLRVAEERRAAKAAAWEEEVRERADAKRTNDRLIAEAEAELEALRRKRADVVARQRRRRALALARADPKNLPRKRSPWGMAGSPGTIDNIRNMSPARGGPVGTRPTFDWTSPWRAERSSREVARTNVSTPDRRTPASRPASALRPPRGGGRSPSSAAGRPATAPSPGGSVARILADAAAADSRRANIAQPYDRARLYASPSDAARAAAERVRARKRAQEERERRAAAAATGPGPARRARKAPTPEPARREASAKARKPPAPAKAEAPPLSWVTVPLASADPPGTKPPTRRELYPTPPTPPRAKPPPTPPRSPARGTGSEARRWAEASTVEKLSDEVHVVKRLVKDQGVHLFGEVEGMKQQMGAMFEMMERVLGKIGDVGGGSVAAKAPGSPFVSG